MHLSAVEQSEVVMAVVQIQMSKAKQLTGFALFNLGFRPFFLGAGVFAMLSIASWLGIYHLPGLVEISHISPSQWHAHEMLYGYGMAVVSGFLLTAVKNWTGVQILHGKPLLGLFALWCVARVLFLFGTNLLAWAAIADLLFGFLLILAIAIPIIKAKQWPQLAVISKVLLLWVGNIVFYLGSFGLLDGGMLYAINGVLFVFVSLILMIGRRVIPFFIERGVAHLVTEKIQLRQYKWLDISILMVFLALFLNEIFVHVAGISSWLALALFALNGYRLYNWHTPALWRVPLVWSLYVASWLINLGFLIYGLQTQLGIAAVLMLHLFTIGGIGLMTLSMMSRVALGHSGRDIKALSPWMKLAFALIVLSAVFRIVLPLLMISHYPTWIMISGVCWIMGFALFLLVYTPILCKPRVDGTYG
jgi:uncharacterized protein involved in response to NO